MPEEQQPFGDAAGGGGMSDLFPTAAPSVSLARQIEAVEREVAMRRRVYPRRVADGRMTQRQADTETAAMEAVLATLRGVTP